MKIKFNLSQILTFCLLGTLVLFSSCKKDDDSNDNPEQDNFVSVYDTLEDCDGFEDDYEITITADDDNDDGILIANLYASGITGLKATVNGTNITIASQPTTNVFGIEQTFSGSGSITDDVLTIDFAVETPGYGSDACTATCTKL